MEWLTMTKQPIVSTSESGALANAMKLSRQFRDHPQTPVLRQNIKALRHASTERGRNIIRGAIAFHVQNIAASSGVEG
jgi:hypothetical protein